MRKESIKASEFVTLLPKFIVGASKFKTDISATKDTKFSGNLSKFWIPVESKTFLLVASPEIGKTF